MRTSIEGALELRKVRRSRGIGRKRREGEDEKSVHGPRRILTSGRQASRFAPLPPGLYNYRRWPAAFRREVVWENRSENMSSCCGGNCGCGSDCKCGQGCRGCKMYPDTSYAEKSGGETVVGGSAPGKEEKMVEGEKGVAGAENGCKCGSNCICNPCTCNK
ncbi:uncharacterized protein LOC104426470 [Eucalyptus grandis]|nr:uncharacterized protein LOC104426470 [Eucalyptus grandis]